MKSRSVAPRSGRWGAIALYSLTVVLSLVVMVFVLSLWEADLRVPFGYHGDALWTGTVIKGMIDHGWYLGNPQIGLPGSGAMYDYPFSDLLHLVTLKGISLATHDYALTMNLFYLLSFPLTAVSAVFVLRWFGLSGPAALVSGLLFAFLPYHIGRGRYHLLLAAYYTIPWVVMVMLWVFRGEVQFWRAEGGAGAVRKAWAAVVICALAAGSGIYYAFFSAFFLVVAGLAAAWRSRRGRDLVTAGVLAAIIAAVVLVNMLPTLWFQFWQGPNLAAAYRNPYDEQWGLKIEQLLLPVDAHRLGWLAQKKAEYNAASPLVNENRLATLGLVGGVGFLYLLWHLLFSRRRESVMDDLAILNASGVLLATLGGFGSLLMMVVLPQIRCYNRISVFLGFFAFFAVGLLLDQAQSRWAKTSKAAVLFWVAAMVVLGGGLLDETTGYTAAAYVDHATQKALVTNDRAFFGRVEASLPPGAMVFQLPYQAFPEAPPVNGMFGYSHFRGYLNTRTLRWSYGAMKGRFGDMWQFAVAGRPVPEMLRALALAGFDGVYVDRKGYADGGRGIEGEITKVLGMSPLVSGDGQMACYRMREFRQRVGKPSQRQAR